VIAFYARAVGGAGYRVAQQMTIGPTAMLTARKGESQAVTITATQAAGATQVQIVVGRNRHWPLMVNSSLTIKEVDLPRFNGDYLLIATA
jgi:hypothetical protein